MDQILVTLLQLLDTSVAASAGFGHLGLSHAVTHLPEPPKYFLEFAAVATVLLIARLRRPT